MTLKPLDVVKLKDGREATVLEVYEDACFMEFCTNTGDVTGSDFISIQQVDAIIWSSK